MIIYVLFHCLTPVKPMDPPPPSCQIVSVHRTRPQTARRAWDRCHLDHECVTHYYIGMYEVEP